MKAVIPTAGLGTRLRPHTLSRPKSLVNVAGKPVLGHVLDRLQGLPIDETIFITGYLGCQVESYVRANYDFAARFVEQEELLGQAHAIHLAREHLAGGEPLLIAFIDTIVEADLAALVDTPDDGAILVKEVEDPRRFGVAVLHDGHIARLIEKPSQPVSNLAVVGVYYLRNSALFLECLEELLETGTRTNGEYYLADALQLMIDRGARIAAFPTDVWRDTGTPEALLGTNRYLLGQCGNRIGTEVVSSTVIEPVYAGPGSRIEGSVVGPYVSIAPDAVVADSILRDCIVGEGAQVMNAVLADSIVGASAVVQWQPRRLNLSDYSQVEDG